MTSAIDRLLAFSTLGQTEMSTSQIVDHARRSGAMGVELRVARGEVLNPKSSLEEAAAVGETLRGAGITLLALGSYIPLTSPARDQVDFDLMHHLGMAHAAGAYGVRVFMQKPPEQPFDEGDREASERLGRVLSSAPSGVKVLVETHDSHSRADAVMRFLESVPAPLRSRVAIIWDTAHTWAAGESPPCSLDTLGDALAHVQVKDVASAADPVPVPLGTGSYPISSLMGCLNQAGWGGPVSLEWERTWHTELPPLSEALAKLPAWVHGALLKRE